MSKQSLSKNKLLKLKEWLTVPEAARHLSNLFDEVVSEADVLQLAINKHLTLSVNFVNGTYVRRGKIVSEEDIIWGEMAMSPFLEKTFRDSSPEHAKSLDEEKGEKNIRYMKSLNIDDKRFINLDKEVTAISGIWDLAMFGNERLDIEHRYQVLTDGPEVTLPGWVDGCFVVGEDDLICQLQESYDQNEFQKGSSAQLEKLKEHIAINNIGEAEAKELLAQHKKQREEYLKKRDEKDRSKDYYPAGGLPPDSVLVVRTKALIDLQERLSQEESDKNTYLDIRAERTYLNIIGALLEVVTGTFKDKTFSSETQLREFIAEKFDDLRGVSPRTLADKFAMAKKALNGELD